MQVNTNVQYYKENIHRPHTVFPAEDICGVFLLNVFPLFTFIIAIVQKSQNGMHGCFTKSFDIFIISDSFCSYN